MWGLVRKFFTHSQYYFLKDGECSINVLIWFTNSKFYASLLNLFTVFCSSYFMVNQYIRSFIVTSASSLTQVGCQRMRSLDEQNQELRLHHPTKLFFYQKGKRSQLYPKAQKEMLFKTRVLLLLRRIFHVKSDHSSPSLCGMGLASQGVL